MCTFDFLFKKLTVYLFHLASYQKNCHFILNIFSVYLCQNNCEISQTSVLSSWKTFFENNKFHEAILVNLYFFVFFIFYSYLLVHTLVTYTGHNGYRFYNQLCFSYKWGHSEVNFTKLINKNNRSLLSSVGWFQVLFTIYFTNHCWSFYFRFVVIFCT